MAILCCSVFANAKIKISPGPPSLSGSYCAVVGLVSGFHHEDPDLEPGDESL